MGYSSSVLGSRILTWVVAFPLGLIMLSNGQDLQFPPQNDGRAAGRTERRLTIKIGVEEVRLDAVVLDQRGHQVTDLTADDFEIYQDERLQQITSYLYMNDDRPQPKTPMAKDAGKMQPLPTPRLKREEVRRMIAFVVDNFSMTFEHVHNARTALKKFVETQMQPGDVVAIVQTAGGSAARQMFSNDKQYLLRAIDKISWYMDWRTIKQYSTQNMAIDYFLRAMWGLPGRKTLILMSTQPMVPVSLIPNIDQRLPDWKPSSAERKALDLSLNPLADMAMRAGVVVHTLDMRGLQGPEVYDRDFGADKGSAAREGLERNADYVTSGEYVVDRTRTISEASAMQNAAMPVPALLSIKTGGLTVGGSNWFVNGIGPVNEVLKGCYMLTYIPPKGTFRSGAGNTYHRIKIRVKRPGLSVYTRDGFFGNTNFMDATLESPVTMRDTIYFPFRQNDLDVNLASGYVHDPQKGYLLRYFMHLDGKNLSIVEGKDGVHVIYIDLACITSSMDQFIQDAGNLQFEFLIKKENIPWIRKHGLRFSLDLPVKKPGAYYVRAAVKDQVSGKTGNAYQFIEIPDLKKSRLSLSNIFIINRDEDAPWVMSPTPSVARNLLYPDMRRDPRKSAALRSYLSGENFTYAAVIYNAKGDSAAKCDLESQFILYGNGQELYKGPTEAVDLGGVSDFTRIPIMKTLHLENSLQPGDYVLVLQVRDKQAKDKYGLAYQTIDFRVLSKVDPGSEEKINTVERKEIALSPEILASYVGTYKMKPGSNATVALEGGRLFSQVTGEVSLPMYPESDVRFFLKAMEDAEYEFVRDDQGAVTYMIVRRGERETKAPRISDHVVERKEISLPKEILNQYVGTYQPEQGSAISITLWQDSQLYCQVPRQRMMQLYPETETKFFLKLIADVEYEFVKNEKGAVTHLLIRQEGIETTAPRTGKNAPKQPKSRKSQTVTRQPGADRPRYPDPKPIIDPEIERILREANKPGGVF